PVRMPSPVGRFFIICGEVFCGRKFQPGIDGTPWRPLMLEHMFHLPSTVTLLEKILRPVLVYLCLICFLRLFGKRELAQLNPFDLVVLLSLSNTVQNAI